MRCPATFDPNRMEQARFVGDLLLDIKRNEPGTFSLITKKVSGDLAVQSAPTLNEAINRVDELMWNVLHGRERL